MCEILISARNVTHADPVKDRQGCVKRGMPVRVEDDDYTGWGRAESFLVWRDEVRYSGPATSQPAPNGDVIILDQLWEPNPWTWRKTHGPLYGDLFEGYTYMQAAGENRNIIGRQEYFDDFTGKWRFAVILDQPFATPLASVNVTIRNLASRWFEFGEYYLFRLPGIQKALMADAIATQYEDDSGGNEEDPETNPGRESFRKRRWILNIDELPSAALTSLAQIGEYSASTPGARNQMRSALRRIRDNATYSGF